MRGFSDHDNGYSTLSDGFDPSAPAAVTPGGLIESVDVSYDHEPATLAASAVPVEDVQGWAKTTQAEAITVNELIYAVQRRVESEYGLALVPQTVTVIVTGPTRTVELPRTPAGSLTEVREMEDGTEQDDIASDYYLLADVLRAKSGRAVGGHPLKVVYDAGYASGSAPPDVQLALKRIITDHYDQRGDLSAESLEEIPRNARSILRSFID